MLVGNIRVCVASLWLRLLLCLLISALDIDLYVSGTPAALICMALCLYKLCQVRCTVDLKRRYLRILVFLIVGKFRVLELEGLTRRDQAFLLWSGRAHRSADARFDASSMNE